MVRQAEPIGAGQDDQHQQRGAGRRGTGNDESRSMDVHTLSFHG
jgi:hypothetical protein